ncbi:translocation and assembly module lipoprotein TamL [Aegicerativicinus sediminis]
MNYPFKYIGLLIIVLLIFSSCNVLKRVGEDEQLLVENEILVNGEKEKDEEVTNNIFQKPNTSLLGLPIKLHIYNLARPNIDSILNEKYHNPEKPKTFLRNLLSLKQYEAWVRSQKNLNSWIKRIGEPPAIFNPQQATKTTVQLDKYYYSIGYFDAEVSYDTIPKNESRKIKAQYNVETGERYLLDSIFKTISTPIVDSLYVSTKNESILKKGDPYFEDNYTAERDRITSVMRNSGVYHFQEDYVFFTLDTIGKDHKLDTEILIGDREIRVGDSTYREPFRIYKINNVNIYPDYSFDNRNETIKDTVTYKHFNFYTVDKLKYRPRALADAIFLTKDEIFRNINVTRTARGLSQLNTFRYPSIEAVEVNDSTLDYNIFLAPRKKYELGFNFDVTQSDIQTIGFTVSSGIKIRNIFRGAENLEFSLLGSIGSSRDASLSSNRDQFFDINEVGANLKLIIPRIFFPFKTDKIIKKYMSPSTRISATMTGQRNIGLDKQTFTTSFTYNWKPKDIITLNADLFNIQYVKNLNVENYFRVYENSFKRLNQIAMSTGYIPDQETLLIPEGADQFIEDVLNNNTSLTPDDRDYVSVANINQRKQRLTQDNLIFAANFGYIRDKRESLFDDEFSLFRFRVELAGNTLSSVSKLINLQKDSEGRYEIFGVPYSQYTKFEVDYIKYWNLGAKNIFAIRAYGGIAIPYGNASNIPFSKSFFAGGPNDNRAWTAYNLGPGSSQTTNEFNEANFKLAFSAEQRFNLIGPFNGAVFVDVGNIWNIFDDVTDEGATFDGFSSLKDIAVGSGFGLRYDFKYFVLRGDVGFKTYNPSQPLGDRWFRNYNFASAVYNIGINYPF